MEDRLDMGELEARAVLAAMEEGAEMEETPLVFSSHSNIISSKTAWTTITRFINGLFRFYNTELHLQFGDASSLLKIVSGRGGNGGIGGFGGRLHAKFSEGK